ncbi:MAG: ATP-binding cassette domain-containing protein [Gammaproteobacteria bacterium]|nr:ATP-binding cassette domain-containing protein [Gammaproteobacteria bacterium]
MTPCVSFEQVTKKYGSHTVFENLTVQCPFQQTTAIVGASGSGKTTVLQLVNGVLRADGGLVRVFGDPVPLQGIEQFRRKIGYAVQSAGLFPHLTAFDNVTLVARLEGWEHDAMQNRFAQLLDEMDLPIDVAQRLPRELSGGQQQRLGLCRAFMLKPKLLLLDEPFSAIDPITRTELYTQFQKVQKHEGVSSLLVTHDLREARRLSDYLVILHEGRLQQCGATAQVLDNPGNDYVSALVESQLI